MAAMLAATPTCHLPRPLVARDGVLRHVYTPSLSLCSGSDLIRDRGRLLMVDARVYGGGGRVCCDGGWRRGERDCAPAVGGECSLEPSVGGRDQEVSVCYRICLLFWMRRVSGMRSSCGIGDRCCERVSDREGSRYVGKQ